jgi:hypothetical protein
MKQRRIHPLPSRRTLRDSKPRRKPWGLCPHAARLLLVGQPLILLGLCDFAARLYHGAQIGEVGTMLRIEDAGSSIGAAMALLWGAALWLDYMEREQNMKKQSEGH